MIPLNISTLSMAIDSKLWFYTWCHNVFPEVKCNALTAPDPKESSTCPDRWFNQKSIHVHILESFETILLMRVRHSAVTQCITTSSITPAEGDIHSDKAINHKLHCGMGTGSRTQAQTSTHLIIQPSRKPHTDDNESLSVASSSIELEPVRRGSSRGRGTSTVPLNPVTSLYSALAD